MENLSAVKYVRELLLTLNRWVGVAGCKNNLGVLYMNEEVSSKQERVKGQKSG